MDQVTAVEEAISIWGRCELEDLIRLLYRRSGRRCLLHQTFNILYFCWRHTRIVYIQYKHLPFPTSPCHPEASPLSLSFQRQSKLTIAASFSHANIQLGSNEHLQQKTVTFSSFVRIWKEKGYILVFLYLSIDKSTEVEKRADLTQPMNWRKKCSIESQPMIMEQCFIIGNFLCHLFENDAGGGFLLLWVRRTISISRCRRQTDIPPQRLSAVFSPLADWAKDSTPVQPRRRRRRVFKRSNRRGEAERDDVNRRHTLYLCAYIIFGSDLHDYRKIYGRNYIIRVLWAFT